MPEGILLNPSDDLEPKPVVKAGRLEAVCAQNDLTAPTTTRLHFGRIQ